MGVSRDTFYRYQEAMDNGGIEALHEKSRRTPNIRNRTDEVTEAAVVQMAVDQPAFDQVRASNELRKVGVFISHKPTESVSASTARCWRGFTRSRSERRSIGRSKEERALEPFFRGCNSDTTCETRFVYLLRSKIKEQIDLVELARLRWVEKWKYERLAEHFGVGRTTVRNWVRRIKATPSLGGLSCKPPVIRGG